MAKGILQKSSGAKKEKEKEKKKKKKDKKKKSTSSSSSSSESKIEEENEDTLAELAAQVGLKGKQMKVKEFVRLDQLSAETQMLIIKAIFGFSSIRICELFCLDFV